MEKRGKSLNLEIERISKDFLKEIKDQEIEIISHFDTDGITSATIMIQTLKKSDQKFNLKIVKSLTKEFIEEIPKDKVILFLDLASGSLDHIQKANLKKVFIIDHHEIHETQEIFKDLQIINPELYPEKIKLSGSALTYLFCKKIDDSNKEFLKLAILGMVGDALENEISNLEKELIEDNKIKIKKGLLIYPSTRPLNRVLEFSSDPFIPGVTGNFKGVLDLLRETKIKPQNGKYKNLIDLDEKEMKELTTAIILRNPQIKNKKMIGEIYLLNFFGKLEDARELSAKINACSRFGRSDVALRFCSESLKIKKQAETIHAKYKQLLISGLKKIEKQEVKKIQGEGFLIINAENEIKDTMIGTIMSILSYSSLYEKNTIIIGLAKYENKIKVSARNVGSNGKNAREILNKAIRFIGGEVGGHKNAAGCVIEQEKEKEFLDELKKNLELQVVKI